MGAAPLNQDKQQQPEDRQASPAEHRRGAKADFAALSDEINQRKHRECHGQHAGDVEAMVGRVAGLLHADMQQRQGEQGQRYMHQEHPAPVRHGQDHGSHHRSETQAHASDHAPYRKGPRTRRRFAELMGQDRKLANHHGPGANALDETRRDQCRRIVGQATGQRGQGEYPQTHHQHTPTTEAIRQGPRRHQHAGAGQGVGIHDPLGVLKAGAQFLFQRRQDDRHAGDFQAEHQGHQADGGEGQAVPGGARGSEGRECGGAGHTTFLSKAGGAILSGIRFFIGDNFSTNKGIQGDN